MKITELKAEQTERAVNFLKALAHPVRIAILDYLDQGKQLSVKEIHELLDIEQATASHHLGILKDKGILISRREGKNTFYFLRDENFGKLIECLGKCACR